MINNWRYSPRTGTYNSVSIVDEAHTIAFDTEANAYGFRLTEAPQQDSPSSIAMTASSTGAITFTEITSRVAPSASQFWVDYDADGFTGTGFVECNASDNGVDILISYEGRGDVINNDNFATRAGYLDDGTPYYLKTVTVNALTGWISVDVGTGTTYLWALSKDDIIGVNVTTAAVGLEEVEWVGSDSSTSTVCKSFSWKVNVGTGLLGAITVNFNAILSRDTDVKIEIRYTK